MPKFRILFVDFPFGGVTESVTSDWITQTVIEMQADPAIGPGMICRKSIDDTPITMSRNQAVEIAKIHKCDYILMVDSDMEPDIHTDPAMGASKPFWSSSWAFMRQHAGPCVIAAPYCGKPPEEVVHVFRWENRESDHPGVDLRINKFTRHEAARATGIEAVAALATGVMLIDTRIFDVMPKDKPYFYYEYSDAREIQKVSTEDVTFSRNLALAGIPMYVNWDSWAGHWKKKRVGKPGIFTTDKARDQMIDGICLSRGVDPAVFHLRNGKPHEAPTMTGAAGNVGHAAFEVRPQPAAIFKEEK